MRQKAEHMISHQLDKPGKERKHVFLISGNNPTDHRPKNGLNNKIEKNQKIQITKFSLQEKIFKQSCKYRRIWI